MIKEMVTINKLEDLAENEYYFTCNLSLCGDDGVTQFTRDEMIETVRKEARKEATIHDWINSYLLDVLDPLQIFELLSKEDKESIIAMVEEDIFSTDFGVQTKESYERIIAIQKGSN